MEPKLKCARTDTTPSSADTLSFVSDICGTLKKLKRTCHILKRNMCFKFFQLNWCQMVPA